MCCDIFLWMLRNWLKNVKKAQSVSHLWSLQWELSWNLFPVLFVDIFRVPKNQNRILINQFFLWFLVISCGKIRRTPHFYEISKIFVQTLIPCKLLPPAAHLAPAHETALVGGWRGAAQCLQRSKYLILHEKVTVVFVSKWLTKRVGVCLTERFALWKK